MTLKSHLQALGVDIAASLEELDAPAALVDAEGTVLWQNQAAVAFVGDQRGARFNAIAADYVQQSRATLRRKTMGADIVSNGGTVVVDANGDRKRIETISLSLLKGAEVVGVIGIVKTVLAEEPAEMRQRLTPRQRETLTLLAAGLTTDQIADNLGVARETARNYIRRLLKTLGAHSRLEAVVRAREAGLL